MKQCTYCGQDYEDELEVCPVDGQPLRGAGAEPASPPSIPEVVRGHVVSSEERRFWERMTFRQFAVLMIRIQAVWLLFDAVVAMTYLPGYFTGWSILGSLSNLSWEVRRGFFLAILRIGMHVAAAVALIQYAERVLSWLVKDSVREQTQRDDMQKDR